MITAKYLVDMAERAVSEGWFYILGGYINKGTDSFIDYKISQYAYNKRHESDIRAYVKTAKAAGKTPMLTDCYGLIKGSAWYDEAKGEATYQKDGLKDRNQAGALIAAQKVGGRTSEQNRGLTWGAIGTLPDIAGVCLYKNGHAGVYIGNGMFIDASGNRKVRKMAVSSYNWTHWFLDTYVDYEGGFNEMWEIKPNDKNIAVALMQALLVLDGYNMGAWGPDKNGTDGHCGPHTQTKILEFKKANKLPATDMIFREADWRKLYKNVQAKIGGGASTTELAKVKAELETVKSQLATTKSQLSTAQASLKTANAKIAGAKSAVSTLNSL